MVYKAGPCTGGYGMQFYGMQFHAAMPGGRQAMGYKGLWITIFGSTVLYVPAGIQYR
jgi:hypothetical protein